ncbi:tetratricopeptide repeat protein [Neosynechococcus sphagnicola]|uniref:tetratricopeptide repeat protein n=1 Tax=Neosynechococcus sphagnicola TaxID=1501145 RepID=UPI00138E3C6B|nr:tetratricopeptide repeat protein [Neosynechococcus sphagnicola]
MAALSQVTLLLVGFSPLPLLAETPAKPSAFPFNPLEMTTSDPLLPSGAGDRPLSKTERVFLLKAVNELNAQGTAAFTAKNKVLAFEIWFRELRLRRYLGTLDEIQALGRVGDRAWKENQATHLRVITERLQAIELGLTSPPLPLSELVTLQSALGQSYEQIRAPELALGVYGQLMARARASGDLKAQEQFLTMIAEVYFNWFDYPQATAAYQELLVLVRQKPAPLVLTPPRRSPTTSNPSQRNTPGMPPGEPLTEVEILLQLAYLAEQDKKPEAAIAAQEQLIQIYLKAQDPKPIPALKLAIAQNYQALNRMDQALKYYQETYNLGVPLNQFVYAADALEQVANFYRSQNQLKEALGIYQYLLDVNQQSDNLMGRMTTFDQMGQIYLLQKSYPQAIAAFRRGLELSKQLNYRQEYFQARIQEVTRQQAQ